MIMREQEIVYIFQIFFDLHFAVIYTYVTYVIQHWFLKVKQKNICFSVQCALIVGLLNFLYLLIYYWSKFFS